MGEGGVGRRGNREVEAKTGVNTAYVNLEIWLMNFDLCTLMLCDSIVDRSAKLPNMDRAL